MAKALDFLGECAVSCPGDRDTVPWRVHYYKRHTGGLPDGPQVPMSLPCRVQVRRDADGLFWTGTRGTGAASWMSATGITPGPIRSPR
jgi:hypothetical protein